MEIIELDTEDLMELAGIMQQKLEDIGFLKRRLSSEIDQLDWQVKVKINVLEAWLEVKKAFDILEDEGLYLVSFLGRKARSFEDIDKRFE